jgi:non-ribosomal peptide synthetase component F
VLQMSDYTFDASVNQVFASLIHGAELHVIQGNLLLDVERLRQYIERNRVRLVNFIPSLLGQQLGEGKKLDCLKVVISGAERLDNHVKDRILAKDYQLHNQYGLTETTIDVLALKCSAHNVHFGKTHSKCVMLYS